MADLSRIVDRVGREACPIILIQFQIKVLQKSLTGQSQPQGRYLDLKMILQFISQISCYVREFPDDVT